VQIPPLGECADGFVLEQECRDSGGESRGWIAGSDG
jgi:hypothetical protein